MGKKPDHKVDGETVSVTAGTLTDCFCTEITPPRDLCDACMTRRRRILARLRKRKDRDRYPAGAALIQPDDVKQLHQTLTAVNALQLAVLDRLARKGQQPRGDTLTLFQHLAVIRGTLTPHLTAAHEELVEAARPKNYDEFVEARDNPDKRPVGWLNRSAAQLGSTLAPVPPSAR